MTKDEYQDAYSVALAFIKYRNGQIHLFKFKDYSGISVGDAIKKYPWILDCHEPKEISKFCENRDAT